MTSPPRAPIGPETTHTCPIACRWSDVSRERSRRLSVDWAGRRDCQRQSQRDATPWLAEKAVKVNVCCWEKTERERAAAMRRLRQTRVIPLENFSTCIHGSFSPLWMVLLSLPKGHYKSKYTWQHACKKEHNQQNCGTLFLLHWLLSGQAEGLMHYHRLLRDGTCAVNYGKHTPFQKGRGHLCFSIGFLCFAPSSRPSLILFLWFPKLLLDTVKFGTGERSGSAYPSWLVESSRLSTGLWQHATPLNCGADADCLLYLSVFSDWSTRPAVSGSFTILWL